MEGGGGLKREELVNKALELGAGDAVFMNASLISVEPDFAEMCKKGCSGYGKAANCPPHVMGPRQAEAMIASFEEVLLFKLDVDPGVLLGEGRFEAFERVFRLAAALEDAASSSGFRRAKGLAAGSCKPVFCKDLPCAVLAGCDCRYPSLARPSLEALGINVFKLAGLAGWPIHRITKESRPRDIPSGMLAGMTLLAW